MKKPRVGKSYTAQTLSDFADKNNYSTLDYGENVVGEGFVVLKHNEKDITISFVLIGATTGAYIYRCVYSDLK